MTKRGDEIARPRPWKVRAADRAAGAGWDRLVAQHPEAADRAWIAITTDPRRVDNRQHPLKGRLGSVTVAGRPLPQWEYEVLSAGRVWYAVDEQARTLWITLASVGHPRQTEKRSG